MCLCPSKTALLCLAREGASRMAGIQQDGNGSADGSGSQTSKEALLCSFLPDAQCYRCQGRTGGKGRTERQKRSAYACSNASASRSQPRFAADAPPAGGK